jgi:hypothetical protein
MPKELPRMLLEVRYRKAAEEYLRRLPPEHFMEATPQATRHEITLESLALVRARRPDVHVFNELLVQYPLPRRKRPGQVVPDNMVVVHPGAIQAEGSYDVPLHSRLAPSGCWNTFRKATGARTTRTAWPSMSMT